MLELEKNLPPLVFDDSLYQKTLESKRLKIGVLKSLEPAIGMCPTATRALEEAQNHLESLGHEVVEIEIPDLEAHLDTHIHLMMSQVLNLVIDNWHERCDDLKDTSFMLALYNAHPGIASTLSKVMNLCKERRLSHILKVLSQVDSDGFTHLVKVRNTHIEAVNKIFVEQGLDALLNIPVSFPAFLSTHAKEIGVAPAGARLAIYWQFPSGTIPVTVVKEDEQSFDEKVHNDGMTKMIKESAAGSAGMPVGIEIIGTPFKDEKVLAIMKILEEKFRFTERYPCPKYA